MYDPRIARSEAVPVIYQFRTLEKGVFDESSGKFLAFAVHAIFRD
jgi:hypothetical protein